MKEIVVKEMAMRTLAILLALTGCVSSEAPEASDDPADVGVTTQALTGVRTGNGTTIFCASTIVLYANGTLQSCVLGNNTGVVTAAGGTVFFLGGAKLIVWPNGTPQRGTLLNNANVRTATGAFVLFQANTEIVMDTSGNAFSGFLATDTTIRTGAGFAPCLAGQRVDMYPPGTLQTGVLFEAADFPNGSGGTVRCNAGHRITLSAAGIFQSCL